MRERPFERSAYPGKHPYGERAPSNKLGRDLGKEGEVRHLDYYLDHPIELLNVRRDPFESKEARKQYSLRIIVEGTAPEEDIVYLVRQDGNVIEIINTDDIPEEPDKEIGMGSQDERSYYFSREGRLLGVQNFDAKRAQSDSDIGKKKRK